MMSTAAKRLAGLGLELPNPATPLAAYVPAVRSGSWVVTSGQLPTVDGQLIARGFVASDPAEQVMDGWVIDASVVSLDDAQRCARQAALNGLAAVVALTGSLDAVVQVVKVTGFVAGVDGFVDHPQVLNGASELLAALWPDSAGHARSAVGVSSLPLGAPVEVELIVEVLG